jgi:hypothetical protein
MFCTVGSVAPLLLAASLFSSFPNVPFVATSLTLSPPHISTFVCVCRKKSLVRREIQGSICAYVRL